MAGVPRDRFEHGFEHDLFLSYSHIDNAKPEQWVSRFHRRLEIKLRQLSGRNVRIWRDDRMGPGDFVDDKILGAVAESALLIPVLSPAWANSAYCAKELDIFSASGTVASATKSRVLPLVLRPCTDDRFDLLRRVLNIPFHLPNSSQHLFVLDEPRIGDPFEERLQELATEALSTLELLERNPLRKPARRPQGRSVFVSGPACLSREEEAVRAELEQMGYAVTRDPGQIHASAVYVQLMSTQCAGEAEGLLERGIAECAGPRLVWLAPDQVSSPLIERTRRERAGRSIELLETTLSKFREHVLDRLSCPMPLPVLKATGQRIYVVFEPADFRTALSVMETLADAQCTPLCITPSGYVNPTRLRRVHHDHLSLCDGVLIVYGEGESLWVLSQLNDIRKIAIRRTTPFQSKAVCLFEPENADKEALRLLRNEFLVLNGLGQADFRTALKPFVESLARSAE